MFEGVTTYPAIVILSKTIPALAPLIQAHQIQTLSLKTMPLLGVSAAFEQQALDMPQAQLYGNANTIEQASWQLETSANAALRLKLTQGYPTLKQVYGSPLYGIKTGLNEAFVIDGATKKRLIAQDTKSAELLKPFLEGKDLKKW